MTEDDEGNSKVERENWGFGFGGNIETTSAASKKVSQAQLSDSSLTSSSLNLLD